ncbi:MAG: hypothetical protein HY934_05725, partial [Candidatus Firestonebacteria bacterium]|nr:hypothetical protein [Candidatus Firestonebacteria bacterium]
MKSNSENNENYIILESIKWILRLRWGILTVLILLFLGLQKELQSFLILSFIAIALITSISLFLLPMLKMQKKNLQFFFFFQLIVDISLFSLSLKYCVNFQNIFSLIYLLPIVISSLVISVNMGLAIASVSSLMCIYIITLSTPTLTSYQVTDIVFKLIFFHLVAFLSSFLNDINMKHKVGILVDKNKKVKDELGEAQKHIIESKK